MYPHCIKDSDLEAKYVIFPSLHGIMIGISPAQWDGCVQMFSQMLPQLKERFSMPTERDISWGYDNCFIPVNRDMFDNYGKLNSWIWWQCSAPQFNIEEDNTEVSVEFKNISRTLDVLLNFAMEVQNDGQWQHFQNNKQLVVVESMCTSGTYPHGGCISFHLSRPLCKLLFEDVSAVDIKFKMLRALTRIEKWISNEDKKYDEEISHYDFRVEIHPKHQRFIMHVPGNCACVGGYVTRDDGLKISSHNVDSLHQQFLHLYGMSVLWKIAWDAECGKN